MAAQQINFLPSLLPSPGRVARVRPRDRVTAGFGFFAVARQPRRDRSVIRGSIGVPRCGSFFAGIAVSLCRTHGRASLLASTWEWAKKLNLRAFEVEEGADAPRSK
jgi:hypothetical protein